MSTLFGFRANHSIRGVDPQAVGEALAAIREEHGTLTPQHVLDAAQSPNSPLHAAFEWDDSAAARQYRLQQARRVIVSIRIINSPVQAPVPVYVSIRAPEQGRSYVPTAEAMSDERLRARVLDEIRQFIESMERRYAHFRQVAEILARMQQHIA